MRVGIYLPVLVVFGVILFSLFAISRLAIAIRITLDFRPALGPVFMLQRSVQKQTSRPPKVHLPLIRLSARDQFHHNITSFIRSTMSDAPTYTPKAAPGLKKISPYWYPYTTMAKERWLGRELLEVVSTEFRDRSMEYYVRVFSFIPNGAE